MAQRPLAVEVRISLALVALSLCFPLSAQESQAKGSLRLQVHAKAVVLRAGDTPQLHWVLVRPPVAADIASLTDETFRPELEVALASFAASQPVAGCLELVVNQMQPASDCSLRDVLRKTLGAAQPRRLTFGGFENGNVSLSRDPLKSAPKQEGATVTSVLLGMTYVAGTAPTQPITSFRVTVESEWARQAAVAGEEVLSRPIVLNGLPAGISASTVTAEALFTERDRYPGESAGGPRFSDDKISQEYARVAEAALQAAAARQMVAGTLPNSIVLTRLSDELALPWRVDPGRTGWPDIQGEARMGAGGTLKLRVSGVRMVRDAHVTLLGSEVAKDERGQSKLDEIRQAAADQVAQAHAKTLKDLSGAIPQLDPLKAALVELGAPKSAEGPWQVKSEDGDLLFTSNFRYVISEIEGKFDASLGFNAEERFTAGGSVSGARLFYLLPKLFGQQAAGDLGERHSLSAKGGPEYQTIDYSLTREIELASGTLLPMLSMGWKRDSSQRFGPGFAAVPEEITRTIEPGISWKRHAESTALSRASYSVSFDLGLPLRHTRLRTQPSAGRDLFDGQSTAVRFETLLRGGFDFTPAAGKRGRSVRLQAGQAAVQIRTEARRGWEILAGDFNFSRYLVETQAAFAFGLTMPDQFQLFYRRSGGTASSATPIFELFRLGGSDNVRGLEMGEFIGRSVSSEQAEFGYNLFEPLDVLGRLLAGKKPPAKADQKPPSIADFLRANGVSSLLLKLAHDRGAASPQGRGIGNLFALEHAAQSWGAGIELGGLRTAAGTVAISFMRARSSSSYAHTKGIWTTGVRVVF